MKHHLFSESSKYLFTRFGPGVALNSELCVFKSRRGTIEYGLKVSFAVHCHHGQIVFTSFVKSGCYYLPFRVLVSMSLRQATVWKAAVTHLD